jgi:hypothetical protein
LHQKAIGAGIVTALCIAAGFNAVKTISEIYLNAPPDRFSSAAQWLKTNTHKNAVVFNNQWDTFPDLFFHDHRNLWVAGLNPNFTYFLEPRLWLLYKNVSDGYVMDTARYLQRDFGASYALTLKKEGGLTKLASITDNGLNPVWEDGQTVIYEVRPSDRLVQMEAELYPYQMKDTDGSVTCKAIEYSECQDDGNPSARAFLQCGTRGRFAKISWTVDIPKTGTWTLAGRFLKTPTGGTAEVMINGKPLGVPVDLNTARRQVGEMEALGRRSLPAGSASVEIAYRLPAGGEHAFGLDVLRFTRSE